MATTIGTLSAEATFESISVELTFSGDAGGNNSALLEYKRSADASWTACHADWFWRIDDGSGTKRYRGKVLCLDPGTAYDVRATVTDANGVSGTNPISTTATTRVDAIPTPAALTVTKYLDAAAAAGGDGSVGTPWNTLTAAIAGAVAGDVISVASGFYRRPTATITKQLTFLGENPAVDDDRAIINASTHAIVYSGTQTGPTGATETHLTGTPGSAWIERTITDAQGVSRTLYHLPTSVHGQSGVMQLGYADTARGKPQRVAGWKNGDSDMNTVAEFADVIYTNRTYRYGFWRAPTAQSHEGVDYAAHDILVRLPPTASSSNPNELYMTVGGKDDAYGLDINVPDFRISGLEFRTLNGCVRGLQNADRLVVDHCLFWGYGIPGGVRLAGSKTGPDYSLDQVVEDNRFEDSHFRAADGVAGSPDAEIPWHFIKSNVTNAAGTAIMSRGGADYNEITAVRFDGGGRRAVIRRNTVSQGFNGVGIGASGFNSYAAYGVDIHDNLVEDLGDDAFEPETLGAAGIGVSCWGIWGNTVRRTLSGVSTGPAWFGPIYLAGNTFSGVGAFGLAPQQDGTFNVAGNVFKYSNDGEVSGTPSARLYLVNNTIWTDNPGNGNGVSGGDDSAGGGGGGEAFWLRNNIFRSTKYAFVAAVGTINPSGIPISRWVEDYNLFGAVGGNGLNYGTADYNTVATTGTRSVADYRTQSGQGAHTNHVGGTDINFVAAGAAAIDAMLTAPASHDLSLADGAGAEDAGVLIAGFHVLYPGSGTVKANHYTGDAPNLGADQGLTEVTVTAPDAPTTLTATANGESQIDLAWTDNADDETSYRVEVSLDGTSDWSTVETIAADSVTYSHTGLPGAATRYYRVAAVNAGGATYSNVDSATTDAAAAAPAAPTDLVVVAVTSARIRLTWVDQASDEITYRVERSTDGTTGWAERASLPQNSITYDDTGLSPEATWYYRVYAVNPQGDSDPTGVASATTPALPVGAGGSHSTRPRTTAMRVTRSRISRSRQQVAWTDLAAAAVDSGTDPWDFDATGKSASATLTRSADSPDYDGTSYLNCAISGADDGSAFARGQFVIAQQAGIRVRYRFGLFLPTGFGAAVTGSMQISRLDPFPTLNSAQGLIYDPAADDWRLFVKDAGTDSDITGRFAISENAWHTVEVQTYLHASDGWARVYLDGAQVAEGTDAKTIYSNDDGAGTRVTRFRCGLVAIGSASQGALDLNIDAVDLDVAE